MDKQRNDEYLKEGGSMGKKGKLGKGKRVSGKVRTERGRGNINQIQGWQILLHLLQVSNVPGKVGGGTALCLLICFSFPSLYHLSLV